jgi:hypothetical protein
MIEAFIPANLWRWLIAAVGLTLLGGLAGWAIINLFLTGYQATIAFPLPIASEINGFHREDELLRSAAWFQDFAAAYKADPDLSAIIEQQLAAGNTKPIAIDRVSRFDKNDLKELPEESLKDVAHRIAIAGRADLVATVKDRDSERASKLADLGIRFARYVLLRYELDEWIPPWRAQVQSELLNIQTAMSIETSDLESSAKRIAGLEALRDKYKDSAAAAPQLPGVQVQVAGSRYLSIAQQLVGLESERVDLNEKHRQSGQSLTTNQTLKTQADRFYEILKAEPNVELAVTTMESETTALLKQVEDPGAPVPVRLALQSTLRDVRQRRDLFINKQFSPLSPITRWDSPPKWYGIVPGAALGLLLGYGLFTIYGGPSGNRLRFDPAATVAAN